MQRITDTYREEGNVQTEEGEGQQKLGEEGIGLSPGASGGRTALPHLDSGLLASKILSEFLLLSATEVM